MDFDFGIVFWPAFSVAVYYLGYLGGWISRGVKEKAARPTERQASAPGIALESGEFIPASEIPHRPV